MKTLPVEPLTKEAFAPFGDVIEIEGSSWFHINNGTTERYHRLGDVQIEGSDGKPVISLARGDAFDTPIEICMLERHPLGSQAWIPFNRTPFVVVVAPNGIDDRPDTSRMRAFYAEGNQGVNYHLGTWHHPLMSFRTRGEFIVVDRAGSAPNCDEVFFEERWLVAGLPDKN
ncbi:ureidoglycolate hydrolase [Neisseria arctica]|uniref:Ureidoglycolate lyase n=1 Tax=Neisseria arctica TaxID=1470200 RepID=A0A0J0YQP9_9NEIS|nr:ureidoglycolate lyase [Neisseria arctica]KLT72439.1 ureidoglycolate hydrolase [Neisseria arctica]UOO85986.1 ureidoglycolate lyase [Neisseria arctica]